MRGPAVFLGVLLVARGAAAVGNGPPPEPPPSESEPRDPNRALAGGAAVVPGAIVHGAGHYVLGEPETATKILIVEGVGLVAIVGGLSVNFLTGASRYLVGPATALTVVGAGLFVSSFAADLYGSLSSESSAASGRDRRPPWVETELGYRRIADPRFDYSDFAVERVAMRTGPLRLEPSLFASLSGDNARYRVEAGYRVLGSEPDGSAPGTSDHLEVVVGFLRHVYSEGFTRSGLELALDARYDLAHVAQTLEGAFVDLVIGYGTARIDYDLPETPVPADTDSLLLTRVAFGVVLRGPAAPGSELVGYYDHRHDAFASGLLIPGLLSGVPGHLGADLRYFFTPNWGLRATAEFGSALVGGASLLFRQAGATP